MFDRTAAFDRDGAAIENAKMTQSSPRLAARYATLPQAEMLARYADPSRFRLHRASPGFLRPVRRDIQLAGEESGWTRIQGVYSRRNVDSTKGQIGAETDINDLLQLDYDDFLASLRSKCPDTEPELLFETSRGCWWGERLHCTFCGLNGTTDEISHHGAGKRAFPIRGPVCTLPLSSPVLRRRQHSGPSVLRLRISHNGDTSGCQHLLRVPSYRRRDPAGAARQGGSDTDSAGH